MRGILDSVRGRYALALLIISPLVFATLWVFASIWLGYLPSAGPLRGQPIELGRSEVVLESVDWKGIKPARLDMELQRFVPYERKQEATISLKIPRAMREMIIDGTTLAHVWQRDPKTNEVQLKPEYAKYELRLTILNGTSMVMQERPIPLPKLFERQSYQAGTEEVFLSDKIELSLIGQLSPYPNDWYQLLSFVQVELPAPLSLLSEEKEQKGFQFFLPIDLSVSLSSEPEGKRFVAGQQNSNQRYMRQFELVITRDRPTIVFNYVLGFVPIVFGLLLAHLLFFHPKSSEVRPEHHLIEATIALLAILPLRLILVPLPPEVQVLTRVDTLLAAGMVLTICLVIVKYIVQLPTRHAPEFHGAAPPPMETTPPLLASTTPAPPAPNETTSPPPRGEEHAPAGPKRE